MKKLLEPLVLVLLALGFLVGTVLMIAGLLIFFVREFFDINLFLGGVLLAIGLFINSLVTYFSKHLAAEPKEMGEDWERG